VYAQTVGGVRAPVVSADESVTVDATVREGEATVRAAVVEREGPAVRRSPENDVAAEQATAQRGLTQLVGCCGHIPALGGVVRGHRSNTNFSLQERDTHVRILLPEARSASVSMESR
jgi:hypothetical protein